MTILEEIVAFKRNEVRDSKSKAPIKILEKSPLFERGAIPLTTFLKDPVKSGIVAEFKRKSPSKGVINDKVVPEIVTKGYANAGASGLSVLTDNNYFGGTKEDLIKVREVNEIPILRKDFTIDEYQIVEAKAIGADVILLIAAGLSKKETLEFAKLAKSLNLQVILEVHDEKELSHLNQYIDILGVNNRNLKTFEVDIRVSIDLVKKIPGDFLKISESGISSPDSIKSLKDHGYDGFLIGENFMKKEDPSKAFSEFVNELKK